ncbi:histone-arginine methyltransferase CARMER isoform X1 [Chironomus tepperi]|uniref:histone-arginine methyltransferase CARMER isoform X1 n=1 Tax=Chironomus tepperi TaxID=113505 RepID=UPI00391FC156
MLSKKLSTNFTKIISLNSLGERTFHHGMSVLCCYDPEGVILKFIKDNDRSISNSNANDDSAEIELEVLVTKKTTLKRQKDLYVITATDDIVFLKLATKEEDRQLDEILKKVQDVNDSVFIMRTEDSSANQYFQFYGYLSQQQNMMQDFVRTSTYQKAIHGNFNDFNGKIVLDVGAGSGILSFFASQAGAAKVYAVEASNMAQYAQQLVAANNLGDRITVIAGKIEEIDLPEKVDIIISEPMGYMLYNERMLETYLHAKKWLKPNGKMFPSRGDLHVAPFCDEALYIEQYNKANFWYQTSFHSVDLSSLREAAMKEYFRQPIVDTFDIRICQAKSIRHVVDFLQADEEDLHKIEIPLEFHMYETGTCHGLAFWFDVEFCGSTQSVWLSTSPTEPLTHWYQVRCLLQNPIFVKQGQLLTGRVLLIANKRQSYDVTIELTLEGTSISSYNTLDLKNPYFRYTGAAQAPPGNNTQSPSELYWNQLDNQGSRTAVNLLNGITVNGLGEVQLDTQTIMNQQNLMTIGNHQTQQYQHIPNPNIHTGSIPSTGRSNYATNNFAPTNNIIVDKSVEDTRMIIEQSNRIMAKNGVGVDDKVVIPANSYIDQPMLSAMQQMFNNGLHSSTTPAQNVKTIYQPQQIYFN